MGKTYALASEKRSAGKNTARQARKERRVPAVVYGHGIESKPLSIDASELLRLYREAGKSSLIDLDVEGKTVKALIHEITIHPVRREIQHVDFYAVNLKEATTVEVPLVFEGHAPAVKDHGGVFTSENDTLSIRCLPTEIPHDIKVDITTLTEIGDHITLVDLNLDTEKYEIIDLEENSVICSVVAPRAIEEEEPAETEEALEGEEGEEGAEGDTEGEEGGEEKKKEE